MSKMREMVKKKKKKKVDVRSGERRGKRENKVEA